MLNKIDFWREVETSPADLSMVRIKCRENKIPLAEMKLGETWEILRIFAGYTEFKYTIKKIGEDGTFLKDFKISKYVFNKELFDLKVKETLMSRKFFKVFDSPITDFAGKIIGEDA